MQSKMTPGPWNAEQVTEIYYAPNVSDAQDCIVIGNSDDPENNNWLALVPHTTREDSANAKAIAAVPDLIAACQCAESNLSGLYSSEHLVMKTLRAALAKAGF